ncbi:ABC transporter ATP-binding protein/permease [Candidatus Dependentiae bacterium]|nr:ABC transporter ATP-binding protein/permease [Candidatus Dependentiae bacterium]
MSQKKFSAITFIQKLRVLLSRRDKIALGLIIIATIGVSFVELTNLSLTMLFISMITNSGGVGTDKYLQYLFRLTGPLQHSQAIFAVGACLLVFYLFRCVVIFSNTYFMQKFMENRRHALTFQFLQNYLHFSYKEYTNQNPATISKLVFTDATNLFAIISSCIIIFSELITFSLIYMALVFISWKMTAVLTFLLSIKTIIFLKALSRKMSEYGRLSAFHGRNIGTIFNESYRNFKLVKLFGHEKYILSRFAKENKSLIRVNVIRNILSQSPRLFLETIALGLLVGAVMYVVSQAATFKHIIPVLAMYTLAFYRFMPSITKIMDAYNQIIFATGTLDLSKNLIYQTETLGNESITFDTAIHVKGLSFAYQPTKPVLSNISFRISKKSRIAFIGESGAGKSTLADILMGFYLPEKGSINIDGRQQLSAENVRSWRKKIGYIPQQIYLCDGTVAENIVLGRKYDEKKIISSLQKANIYNFLMEKDGLETKVGEGGVLLSGGQMQRIAIARALYSDPEILVLDEATSALDNATEINIMNEIYSLDKDKTLIVIAHRLSTVLQCEKVYKIENQNIELVDKKDLYQQFLSISQAPAIPNTQNLATRP